MTSRRCGACGGDLLPIHEELRIDRPSERPIVIQLPAWRCEPCRATSGEIMPGRVYKSDPLTIMFFDRPWREIDKPAISDEDLDANDPPIVAGDDEPPVLDGRPFWRAETSG